MLSARRATVKRGEGRAHLHLERVAARGRAAQWPSGEVIARQSAESVTEGAHERCGSGHVVQPRGLTRTEQQPRPSRDELGDKAQGRFLALESCSDLRGGEYAVGVGVDACGSYQLGCIRYTQRRMAEAAAHEWGELMQRQLPYVLICHLGDAQNECSLPASLKPPGIAALHLAAPEQWSPDFDDLGSFFRRNEAVDCIEWHRRGETSAVQSTA